MGYLSVCQLDHGTVFFSKSICDEISELLFVIENKSASKIVPFIACKSSGTMVYSSKRKFSPNYG